MDDDDDLDFTLDADNDADDLARALADLAKLRANVQNNLRLRPIRSFSALPKLSSPPTPSPVYYTPDEDRAPTTYAWNTDVLSYRLAAPKHPIVLDTRPLAAYHTSHFVDSVNIAIPSLILKRCRKPGSGFQSLSALRQFITSDQDKHRWDTLPSSSSWDGDVVIVHGVETDESEIDNLQVTAWALLPVISSFLGHGRVHYLRGGMAAAQSHRNLQNYLVTRSLHPPDPDDPEPPLRSAKSKGLFQLNTSPPTQTHFEIDQPMPSPLPIMPTATSDQPNDANGSPPPSQLSFRRPPPPRRPSVPNLTRIITNGDGEQQLSLPRLQIRTAPTRSATLPITPSQLSASPNGNTLYLPPQSPSHLNLLHSHHTPPAVPSPRWTTSPAEFLPPPSPRFARPTPPRTPETPLAIPHPIPSPRTARPDDLQTTSTEGEFPTFAVSMILPNFLYLGPELTLPEHVQELKSLGVKRILNIAAECDDDHGLNLRENFERYVRIPMRDTVEEDQITRGLKEACETLGRASLHFLLPLKSELCVNYLAPPIRILTFLFFSSEDEANLFGASTYVHCKAGKSRSVTAVMAYLIHANHWTLSRAYAFVLERRKGISPNIGFVSELMTFEEQELGGKSVGVVPVTPGQGDTGGDPQTNYAYASQSRRPGHARESLPPMCTVQDTDDVGEVAMGQDMEIKDKEGRYRHMRRAPVDENTLQPLRRVSKAGLESGF